MQSYKKILILGGTNFMGKTLLSTLTQHHPSSMIVCVNRGKSYWNNQARTQNPNVQYFYCDRRDHKDTTNTIAFISAHLGINTNNKWDLVIDFCAYRWRDVQSVTKSIATIAQGYVFISTDSVYNSSGRKFQKQIREDGFDIEKEYKMIKEIREKQGKRIDSYGYNKMKCQLYLNRIKPLPFICLRLPDVIGPFDNTQRLWCTIEWVRRSHEYPISISAKEEREKLSFVDSVSVARFISNLIGQKLRSKAYNLSFRQGVTLHRFLQLIGQIINPDVQIKFKPTKQGGSYPFYPSVQCGMVSCQSAIEQINWNPLPLKQALTMAVDFFVNKASGYAQQKRDMEKQFKRKVIKKQ